MLGEKSSHRPLWISGKQEKTDRKSSWRMWRRPSLHLFSTTIIVSLILHDERSLSWRMCFTFISSCASLQGQCAHTSHTPVEPPAIRPPGPRGAWYSGATWEKHGQFGPGTVCLADMAWSAAQPQPQPAAPVGSYSRCAQPDSLHGCIRKQHAPQPSPVVKGLPRLKCCWHRRPWCRAAGRRVCPDWGLVWTACGQVKAVAQASSWLVPTPRVMAAQWVKAEDVPVPDDQARTRALPPRALFYRSETQVRSAKRK